MKQLFFGIDIPISSCAIVWRGWGFHKAWCRVVQLSFEIQDKDTNLSLTANLLMLNASSENVTSDVLGFLLHGNEKLTVLTTSLLFEVSFFALISIIC